MRRRNLTDLAADMIALRVTGPMESLTDPLLRLGQLVQCESARGPGADRRRKCLISERSAVTGRSRTKKRNDA